MSRRAAFVPRSPADSYASPASRVNTTAPSALPPRDDLVLVVDDDAAMRAALRRLFVAAGLAVELFDGGAALLASDATERAACLVLDVRMPGMDGLEVQAELRRRGQRLPTVFLTGAADVPLAVAAMRDGALDFIEKPFDPEHLVARVRQAVERGRRLRQREAASGEVRARLARLTPREREVLDLVVTGLTNKEIARLLGTSHRTVDIHRSHVMAKMGASSLADLVRDILRVEGGQD